MAHKQVLQGRQMTSRQLSCRRPITLSSSAPTLTPEQQTFNEMLLQPIKTLKSQTLDQKTSRMWVTSDANYMWRRRRSDAGHRKQPNKNDDDESYEISLFVILQTVGFIRDFLMQPGCRPFGGNVLIIKINLKIVFETFMNKII